MEAYIKNYEEFYTISDDGLIKSIKTGKIRKSEVSNYGYERITLSKSKVSKKFMVHRLVAEAFIPNDDPQNKTQVHHIDNNKLNNCVSNLQWVSNSENQLLSYKDELRDSISTAKLVLQYNKEGEYLQEYSSISEAHRKTKVRATSIGQCCNGRLSSAGGFIWKFKNELHMVDKQKQKQEVAKIIPQKKRVFTRDEVVDIICSAIRSWDIEVERSRDNGGIIAIRGVGQWLDTKYPD